MPTYTYSYLKRCQAELVTLVHELEAKVSHELTDPGDGADRHHAELDWIIERCASLQSQIWEVRSAVGRAIVLSENEQAEDKLELIDRSLDRYGERVRSLMAMATQKAGVDLLSDTRAASKNSASELALANQLALRAYEDQAAGGVVETMLAWISLLTIYDLFREQFFFTAEFLGFESPGVFQLSVILIAFFVSRDITKFARVFSHGSTAHINKRIKESGD